MRGPGEDSDIYVFVLTPPHSYEFPEQTKHSGMGAQPAAKPHDSVFVVYAEIKPIAAEITANLPAEIREQITGSINYWE